MSSGASARRDSPTTTTIKAVATPAAERPSQAHTSPPEPSNRASKAARVAIGPNLAYTTGPATAPSRAPTATLAGARFTP